MKAEKICTEIIDHLIASGFKFQVTRHQVEKAIMVHRGIDERTIERWLKALITFEYLIPVASGVYKLNPFRIPELINHLKEKPQTKLQ